MAEHRHANIQFDAAIAERNINEDGNAGKVMGSINSLVNYLRELLPGWDVEEVNRRAEQVKAKDMDALYKAFKPKCLLVLESGYVQSGGDFSDAVAMVSTAADYSVKRNYFVFHYGALRDMTELVLCHEAAHILAGGPTENAGPDGHNAKWADLYLGLVKRRIPKAHPMLNAMIGDGIQVSAAGAKVETSPLDYHGHHPDRLAIYEDGFKGTDDYTRDHPGLVAFADWSWVADETSIHFVFVDPAARGRGHARRLIQEIYDRTKGDVDWGRIMETEAWHLYEQFRAKYPDRYQRGSNWS